MKKAFLLFTGILLFFYAATYATLFLLAAINPPKTSPFTEGLAKKMLVDTSQYIKQNEKEDSTFIYNRNANSGENRYGESQTRQLLTMHAIANAAKFTKDTSLLDLHKRNIAYIRTLYKQTANGIYIQNSGGSSLINDTAFAILTLIDAPDSSEYKTELVELGTFLLSRQRKDGTFNMLYPDSQQKLLNAKSEYELQRFGSGEALLACVKLYETLNDKRYLTCAQHAFSAYYPKIRAKFSMSFGSWHTIAYAHLYVYDKQQKYLDAIRFMSREMIKQQNQSIVDHAERGGFDINSVWYSSAEAVYTESLGYAYRMLHDAYPADAENAKRANELGLTHLRSLQNINAKNPTLVGGIRSDEDLYEITIDNNGHTIMALMEYLTRNKNRKL